MFSRVGPVRAAVLVKHDGSGTQTGRWHFGPSGSRSIQVFAARQPLRRIAPRWVRASGRRGPDCPADVAGNCRRSLGASTSGGYAVPPHVRARSAGKERWDEINSQVYRAISKYIVGNDIKFGAVVVLASGKKS